MMVVELLTEQETYMELDLPCYDYHPSVQPMQTIDEPLSRGVMKRKKREGDRDNPLQIGVKQSV